MASSTRSGTKISGSSASAGSQGASAKGTSIPLYDNTPEYGVPDEESPELTPERAKRLLTAAEYFAKYKIRAPGRPKAVAPKVSVHIRLDADIVEHFKREGAGWQTRLNGALGDLVRRPRR